MAGVAFLLPWLWPVYPAPGVFRSKESARAYHCERAASDVPSPRTATRAPPPPSRGIPRNTELIVCTQPMVPDHLRAPEDEVLLRTLDVQTRRIAAAAHALSPELQSRTWLVDAHDASPAVSAKLRFATQNALMEQGAAVSDRTPALGFRELQALAPLPPSEAHPAACARSSATGRLDPDEVLLVLLRPDARATRVVGGVCTQGRWTWL